MVKSSKLQYWLKEKFETELHQKHDDKNRVSIYAYQMIWEDAGQYYDITDAFSVEKENDWT